MSFDYRKMSTPALVRRWERLRRRALAGGTPDMDELSALRREIDRRKGERNPTVEIDFESYITD